MSGLDFGARIPATAAGGWWSRWEARLRQPVDAASIGFFRIVFGLTVAWDAWRYLTYGWVHEYYERPLLNFTYLYLDFVRPLPAPGMHIVFWMLIAAGLLVAAGTAYRASSALLFVTYAYVFLCEKSVYMNHHYFMLLVAFLLMWMPADRAYAAARAGGQAAPPVVPRWAVWILRFQIFVVYFYGGLAKLNHDWLRCEPMYSIFSYGHPEVPAAASLLPPALLACFIAYAGIAIDLAVPVLLCFRRTFPAGFVLAAAFHLLNAVFLRIGVFSYLMLGAIPIFLSPSWPRQAADRLRRICGRPSSLPRVLQEDSAVPLPRATSRSRLLILGLHVYAAFQLLFPFRHLLYPGPVSWTEEGHRFSWHMKLRRKEFRLTVIAADPAGRWERPINPGLHLVPRQIRKLGTFPDILVQYAHFLARELRRHGLGDVVIRARWECSLNGRPYQLLVDPEVDLSRVELSLRPARWILPLEGGSGAAVAQPPPSAGSDRNPGAASSSP